MRLHPYDARRTSKSHACCCLETQHMHGRTHPVDLNDPVSVDRVAGQQLISELSHRQLG